jgi:hypothetical protein
MRRLKPFPAVDRVVALVMSARVTLDRRHSLVVRARHHEAATASAGFLGRMKFIHRLAYLRTEILCGAAEDHQRQALHSANHIHERTLSSGLCISPAN